MFIYIIILFIIGINLNIIAVSQVRKRAELRLIDPYIPLPDVVHDYFPKISVLIPDYFLFFCITLIIFNYNSLFEIERNMLCMALCIIIRSFSVFLTILPTCMSVPNKNPNIYESFFLSTHDLMFSGHSILFIGIGQMLNNFFIQIFGPFLLIISRQHYTIDVCVSGLVYFLIYSYTDLIIIISNKSADYNKI